MNEKNKPSLHDEIMRIPCDAKKSPVGGVNSELAYKAGHRDARHAAAELAAGFESEIDQLRAEVEALRKDAERYRWLRRQPNDCSAPRIDICHWQRNGDDSVNEGEGLRLEAADEAIDAAMAAKEGV